MQAPFDIHSSLSSMTTVFEMAVYVWEITACVSNEYTEMLLPLVRMSGCPMKAKETGLECCLNNSLSYARSVEILDLCFKWHYDVTVEFSKQQMLFCSVCNVTRSQIHVYLELETVSGEIALKYSYCLKWHLVDWDAPRTSHHNALCINVYLTKQYHSAFVHIKSR